MYHQDYYKEFYNLLIASGKFKTWEMELRRPAIRITNKYPYSSKLYLVFLLRSGLIDNRIFTLKEIGRLMGVSETSIKGYEFSIHSILNQPRLMKFYLSRGKIKSIEWAKLISGLGQDYYDDLEYAAALYLLEHISEKANTDDRNNLIDIINRYEEKYFDELKGAQ